MKNIFMIFLFLNLGIILNAQELDNPRFKLTSSEVVETIRLQTNPVHTTDLHVTVFTAGDKRINTERVSKKLTIHRGKATHDIDVSSLSAGEYFIEITQSGKGRIFRKKIIKK